MTATPITVSTTAIPPATASRLVRRQRIGRMYPEEPLPDDRLSYVLDVLGLRDPGMHRVDLARATSRPLLLGAHDRVITAQVIADLAHAWDGPPVLLKLTGPAGGSWTLGSQPPAATVQADAVDYLRALSGRNDHPDLQATGDPHQQPQPPPPASYSDCHRHTHQRPEPAILRRSAPAQSPLAHDA